MQNAQFFSLCSEAGINRIPGFSIASENASASRERRMFLSTSPDCRLYITPPNLSSVAFKVCDSGTIESAVLLTEAGVEMIPSMFAAAIELARSIQAAANKLQVTLPLNSN